LEAPIGQKSNWPLTKWENIAWITWIAILLFICLRSFVMPNSKTVYPTWSSTSQLWWSQGELYGPNRPAAVQSGFRYSPTFPILISPFAWFPDAVGGVLWRCTCTVLFAAAAGWWVRAVLPVTLSRDQTAQLFLLLLPLSIQSMSNGQANVPVVTLLLATVAAVMEKRWNWASLFVALAFACKIYPLALGLVLLLLYPRQLGWRIPVALLAILGFPFLTQQPDYVLDQYQKWIVCLKGDDRSSITWDQMYRDLWMLIRAVNAPISRPVYEVLQVLGGVAVAALCWFRQRSGWPEKQSLNGTLALVTAWMMLLGPATESCTFILMAPSLAWYFLEVLRDPRLTWRRGLLFASGGLFFFSALVGGSPKALEWHSLGLHPIATLLFVFYLLTETRPRLVDTASQSLPALATAA
jgi:hypothetical protein